MQHSKFVGEVQHRARLGDHGKAERAIHATLETLAERLAGGEAEQLAAQLPPGIKEALQKKQRGVQESFDLEEFYQRVTKREGVDLPDAIFHARAVISVLRDAVSQGELEDVRQQLPPEYNDLFEAEFEQEDDTKESAGFF